MDRESLVEAVRLAGVVGSGGAGFPAHVKLQAKGIDTYLVNGAECEPLLEGDRTLMAARAFELVSAADTVAGALGATAVFALKEKYHEAAEALRKAGATVTASRDYYPLGDEVILIWETLGRIVPEGGLPLDVGVVVNNVETVLNIHGALQGKPVTHTFVSSGGAVASPGLFHAPVGASAREVIEASGGVTVPDPVYVDGGPMMGRYADDPDFPVTKTTKAILVLPRDSLLARMEQMPVKTMLKQARVSCCQCNQCTLACSRYLVGIGIEPHKIMRAMAFEGTRNREVLQMALALLGVQPLQRPSRLPDGAQPAPGEPADQEALPGGRHSAVLPQKDPFGPSAEGLPAPSQFKAQGPPRARKIRCRGSLPRGPGSDGGRDPPETARRGRCRAAGRRGGQGRGRGLRRGSSRGGAGCQGPRLAGRGGQIRGR